MTTIQNTQPMIPAAAPMQPMQAGPMLVPVGTQRRMNISAIKGLGITQIIIGVLVFCLGIAVVTLFTKHYWLTNSGGGIWGGIWISVTGIIGVCSAAYPNNGALNGTNMAFSIIATVVVFIDGIMFSIGLAEYNNCDRYGGWYFEQDCSHATAGRAVYSLLLLLMIAEFFVALFASIYCCQSTNCCLTSVSQAMIVQQAQPQYIVTSSTGQTFMTPVYPQNVSMAAQYTMTPQQPPMMQQSQITVASANNTNVAYSSQYPIDYTKIAPPPYTA